VNDGQPGTVGIVGVGNMGLAMALRLLDQRHAVAVCDIDPARSAAAQAAGASVAATPAGLAACGLVIVAVVDGDQTREVLFGHDGLAYGLVVGLPAGATVMLCPTIAPADTEACAQGLAARGLGCIDAPMSGGPARARDGTMSLMVACDEALFERWQPLLSTLASRLFRVGARAGDGARTKLVNNLLAAVNLAGAAEALALAARLGLDPALTLSVIEQSSGQSWIASDRLRRALAGDTAPQAHMALLAKDSKLALQAALPTGMALPVGSAAARHFAQALEAGLTREDDSALWRWLRG
jgi:3-hydroxyisobutyrate dehydrogenase-like beta-hydroxyacid dehydrogenase